MSLGMKILFLSLSGSCSWPHEPDPGAKNLSLWENRNHRHPEARTEGHQCKFCRQQDTKFEHEAQFTDSWLTNAPQKKGFCGHPRLKICSSESSAGLGICRTRRAFNMLTCVLCASREGRVGCSIFQVSLTWEQCSLCTFGNCWSKSDQKQTGCCLWWLRECGVP